MLSADPMSEPSPSRLLPLRQALTRLGELLLRWDPARHPLWLRLLVAVGLTLLAVWLRVAIAPPASGGRFITLGLAAALSALYGGFRAGLLSTVLGVVIVNFLLVQPFFAPAINDPVAALWLNLWHVVTQLVVVGAIALLQRQHRSLRLAQARIQRSDRQLLDTFEHSGAGMAHTQLDGHWIRVNRAYAAIIGRTPDELLGGLTYRDFTHPDDLPLDEDQLRRALAGEIDHYAMEKRYLHKAGHIVWVQVTVALIRNAAGVPDYLIAVVQDITARKATEQRLLDSERLLNQAHQLAGLASWQADLKARRFMTLSGSHRVLGLPREDMSADEMTALTHPDDRVRVEAAWIDSIKRNTPYNIDYRMNIGGEMRWVSVRAEFERDARGHALRAIGVTHDITARKQGELQIRQLNASLEQRIAERTQALRDAYAELESYSYAVAHDLRSPLRIINGFAAALREDNPGLDAASDAHLQRIMDASSKMGALIDGLLHLSQFSHGDVAREPVDLSAVATRLLRELATAEPHRRVAWSVQPGLTALADPALVEALLQNLLHNAWKYTAQRDEAHIRVGQRENGGRREFVVSDDGAGFDMARAAKLFQPFQRLHRPGEFAGLGIGLATVRRIVQRHGGEIHAEAVPGQGATFRFTLQPAG